MKNDKGVIDIIFEKFSEEGNPVIIPMGREGKYSESIRNAALMQ